MQTTITLSPSGQTFSCEKEETILESAIRQGFSFAYGCQRGNCAACKGKLLSGTIDYEDPDIKGLEKIASDEILYCSAIPQTDIEIESTEVFSKELPVPEISPCKVVGKKMLADDVIHLQLKLPDAINIRFHAGQYLDILLPDASRRSFSIASAPHDNEFIELHIRHVPDGEYTDFIKNKLAINDLLRIEIPLGTFFLRENSQRPIIFIGGGTGFAPLKAMLEHAFYKKMQNPIHLFWGVRAKQDLYLNDLPVLWEKQFSNFKFFPVLSKPLASDNWEGDTGYVHKTVLEHFPDMSAVDVYISGPPVMIDTAKIAFIDSGLSEDRMFSDAFEYNAHPDAD